MNNENRIVTPLMQQYFNLRKKYHDAIIFFRLGDFYEMFDEDAHWVSRALGLTLTSRHGYVMCGVPHHTRETYVQSLLDLGRKVAICEQISIPTKGLAERDVVEVMTPGSVLSSAIFQDSQSQYLASLALRSGVFSFSYIDISTGEFVALEHKAPWINWLGDQLDILRPKEMVIQESLLEPSLESLFASKKILTTAFPDWFFDEDNAYKKITNHFGVINLKGFGFSSLDVALAAAGALLSYLEDNTRHHLPHIQSLKKLKLGQGLVLDQESRRNLELFEGQNQDEHTSLYYLLNETLTAPGARLLRTWMNEPLSDRSAIEQRLDLVTRCYQAPEIVSQVRLELEKVHDIARLSGRISMDRAHAKDIVSLAQSLDHILAVQKILPSILKIEENEITQLNELCLSISQTLLDNPSTSLSEGKMIRPGAHEELDYYQKLASSGLSMIDDYVKEERTATGLSLRLKENRVVGYYFEINKAQASQLPGRFIHRQSMMSGERYTTDQLIRFQADMVMARDKVIELERLIFLALVKNVQSYMSLLFSIAHRLATCDVITTFAHLAHKYRYCRPKILENKKIHLKRARHPVVERMVAAGEFVANDLSMDNQEDCLLITGPNMAGKSTYLRQNALIVFMAALGCYVPADEAEIGQVDRIFCRIGSGDNLAKGESTFLLEMTETARILHYATKHSFVIMDEVGRGTGSDDGLAIARAVLENLSEKIHPYLLFATHYHELTRLQNVHIHNYSLAILEERDQIYFLKKIQKGPAKQSYGIHVARLAGIPESVLSQAEKYLLELLNSKQQSCLPNESLPQAPVPPEPSFSLKDLALQRLLDEISDCSINDLTPVQALNVLADWQRTYHNIKTNP